MYLPKSAQYQSREYVEVDEEGNLYNGIVAFMVFGLKQSTPFVVQAIPEVTFNRQWLAEKISHNTDNLTETGLSVRGIFTGNHSVNVNAFSALIKIFNSESNYYIKHPQNSGCSIVCSIDTDHLMKNIRNNLLNKKGLCFQSLFVIVLYVLIMSQSYHVSE